MRKTTIKDIQLETGLSLGTISNYLNGKVVKQVNAELIDRAIAKLDYQVNVSARGLKTSKSKLIGMVLPTYDIRLFNRIAQKLEAILGKDGYSLIIASCNESESREVEIIDMLIGRNIDGLVIVPTNKNDDFLKRALRLEIPTVIFDRQISEKFDTVLIDNEQAVYQATEKLINLNHSHIGIICGPKGNFTSELRLKGYKKAFADHCMEVDERWIYYGDYHIQSGHDGMNYFATQKDVTAIICLNGDMSTGAVIKLNQQREQFYNKINLVIFDYRELSDAYKDGMPVIVQPVDQIVKEIYRLLTKRLSVTEDPVETVSVKAEIINKNLFRTK